MLIPDVEQDVNRELPLASVDEVAELEREIAALLFGLKLTRRDVEALLAQPGRLRERIGTTLFELGPPSLVRLRKFTVDLPTGRILPIHLPARQCGFRSHEGTLPSAFEDAHYPDSCEFDLVTVSSPLSQVDIAGGHDTGLLNLLGFRPATLREFLVVLQAHKPSLTGIRVAVLGSATLSGWYPNVSWDDEGVPLLTCEPPKMVLRPGCHHLLVAKLG